MTLDRALCRAGGTVPERMACSSMRKDSRMKRSALWGILLSALVIPVGAHASSSVGISINIGDAPPPPVFVYRQQPRMVVVPNSTVYVVQDNSLDCDVFRYGVYW